jgi:hypothetical protein
LRVYRRIQDVRGPKYYAGTESLSSQCRPGPLGRGRVRSSLVDFLGGGGRESLFLKGEVGGGQDPLEVIIGPYGSYAVTIDCVLVIVALDITAVNQQIYL